jgi:DNA-binding NarL/FixJ family response regulator
MSRRPATVRVAIVDDDALVRAGLRMILASADDIEIVGEAGDGLEAGPVIDRCAPHVVLMDIRMPHCDGISATAALRARPGAPEVIVLTTFDLDDHVLDALRAGASGFLLKDTPPAEIVGAVRRVAAGEAMLSPGVTRTLIDHVADDPGRVRRRAAAAMLDELTERERDVALLIGEGRSNGEIGVALHLSEATVKSHVTRILGKLDAANRVQVAILVHDAGLDEAG